jgi:hypothetical protein
MTVSRVQVLTAIRAAHNWVATLDIPADDPDSLLRGAFSAATVQLLHPQGPGLDQFLTQAEIDGLQSSENPKASDPILLLTVCAAAHGFGLRDASLQAKAQAFGETLARWPAPVASDLALATSLLRACGIAAPDTQAPEVALPSLPELVAADRASMLNVSAWGRMPVDQAHPLTHLPALAASWAREWDLELTCALLRACCYLKLSSEPAFAWSLEWLLDQQQDDGRFGLLAPEARSLGRHPDDWRMYFEPTTNAIWTLAEFCRPGLFLALTPPR